MNFHQREHIDGAGDAVLRGGVGYRLGTMEKDCERYRQDRETFGACAGAALYAKRFFTKVGLFDSDFFAYCEDTDLGLRGRLAGWGAVLATDAVVRHKYSQTGGKVSPLKLRLVERNHYWVAVKSFPLPLLCLVPFMTVGRFFHQGRAFFSKTWRQKAGVTGPASGSLALVAALLKGMWEALAGCPVMLHRRHKVQAQRRLSTAEVWKLFRQYRLTFGELFDNAG
jgi:GT2 family glycosyltransferase